LFYKRYLDDTFVVFNNESHATQFFDFINTFHPNIRFTVEKEINSSLPFLDMSIQCTDGKFTSSIYRKPTFTGLLTSYFSFTPILYKMNAIRTLVHRAYNLSSSYFSFSREIDYLRTIFDNNGYPARMIDNCVNKFLNRKLVPATTSIPTVPKKQVYVSLPYIGPDS